MMLRIAYGMKRRPTGGGGNTYELIETITVDETVSSIVRDKEPDGTAYKLKAVGIVTQCTVGDINTGIMIQANYNKVTIQTGFVNGAINNTVARYGYARIYQQDGIWLADGSTAVNAFGWTVNQMTGYSPSRAYNMLVRDYPYINTITALVNTSNATIPSGSIIQIYGVRA